MAEAARLARRGVEARYGGEPRKTYAVGTSNGGYQVRKAVESILTVSTAASTGRERSSDPDGPNLLTDLPPAILNYPDYLASSRTRTVPRPITSSSPAIRRTSSSAPPRCGALLEQFLGSDPVPWQKRLDPTYDTYGAGTGTYNYQARRSVSDVGANIEAFATTGKIRRPLITVAGTMDALLPIDHHARAYARKVAADQAERGDDDEGDGKPAYRLYEVQNGNHIETYKPPGAPPTPTFPQLEFIEPHAQTSFDLLVNAVEHRASLPPSQCIPRGGTIAFQPDTAGPLRQSVRPLDHRPRFRRGSWGRPVLRMGGACGTQQPSTPGDAMSLARRWPLPLALLLTALACKEQGAQGPAAAAVAARSSAAALSLTGPAASYGAQQRAGIQAALDDVTRAAA